MRHRKFLLPAGPLPTHLIIFHPLTLMVCPAFTFSWTILTSRVHWLSPLCVHFRFDFSSAFPLVHLLFVLACVSSMCEIANALNRELYAGDLLIVRQWSTRTDPMWVNQRDRLTFCYNLE